jgi:hypothetical protein
MAGATPPPQDLVVNRGKRSRSTGIHRSPIAQTQPATPDAIDEPERQRDQDGYAQHHTDQREDQHPAYNCPQQCKPKGADLPAVVRIHSLGAF